MKASTQIWLATALLHREQGIDADLDVGEVVARAIKEGWGGVQPQTLRAHASSHCVATMRPSPAHLRILTRTGHGRVRLFRPGDRYHPDRADGAVAPESEDVPADLRWVLGWVASAQMACRRDDALAEWEALGRSSGIWRNVDPDKYVRSLRGGWD
jgi:hypothetical protein